MITITRSQLRRLRAVFRRALRLSSRDVGPNLLFATGADCLRIRAQNHHAAVEYHTQGVFPAERICVPFALLADCEGTKDEPVNLEQTPEGKVTAQWTDRKIPQRVQYDSTPSEVPIFPVVPSTMAENEVGLWQALADATDTTEANAARYATNNVQLRGTGGRIVATDGRQLLVQRGFNFPWEDDVLVPRSTLFTCKDLLVNAPLLIGKSDDWLTLQSGDWTFHLAIDKDGRFPKTEDFVQRPETAVNRLTIAPADAEFLTDAIERLPCDEEDFHRSVTVDLNGQVILRAKTSDSKAPTELVLTRSTASGDNLRFVTNRTYLARALKLGFRELCMYGAESPAQAMGDNRAYVWAVLAGDTAIKPSKNAVRIDSSEMQSSPAAETLPLPPPTRSVYPMVKSNRFQSQAADVTAASETAHVNGDGGNGNGGNGNGTANGNGHSSSCEPADLIEQAETLRSMLRTALGQVSDMITALKQQKKTAKSVQTALATLRQLDRVAL